MALDPLATTADLDVRTISWEDQALAEEYLQVSTDAVRDAAGCAISEVTSTVDLWADDDGPYLVLPGQPVTAVVTVVFDGQTLTQDVDYVLREGALWRPDGWRSRTTLPQPTTVTITHGLTTVPRDIVDLVCRMTASALIAAAADEGGAGLAVGNVTSERLGDYAVTYSADSGTTEMELSDRLRARLRSRFGNGAAMVKAQR